MRCPYFNKTETSNCKSPKSERKIGTEKKSKSPFAYSTINPFSNRVLKRIFRSSESVCYTFFLVKSTSTFFNKLLTIVSMQKFWIPTSFVSYKFTVSYVTLQKFTRKTRFHKISFRVSSTHTSKDTHVDVSFDRFWHMFQVTNNVLTRFISL